MQLDLCLADHKGGRVQESFSNHTLEHLSHVLSNNVLIVRGSFLFYKRLIPDLFPFALILSHVDMLYLQH